MSARQPMCERRVSWKYERQLEYQNTHEPALSSLLLWPSTSQQPPLLLPPCYSPVTCVTAMQAPAEADATAVEKEKPCSCKQLAWPRTRSRQLMSVNGDKSAFKASPLPTPGCAALSGFMERVARSCAWRLSRDRIKIFGLPERTGLTDISQELWRDLVYQASAALEINTPILLWPGIRLT